MLRKTRDEWVKALRSGDYQQTRGAYRDDTRYCCLGVLADLNGFLTPVIDVGDFIAAVGLDIDMQGQLAELNDLVRLDFPSIANWIEEKVPVDD